MLLNKLLVLLIFLSFSIYSTNSAYVQNVEGNKLVYTGTTSDTVISNVVLSGGVATSLKIPFTCADESEVRTCKTADLEFNKLIGNKATFYSGTNVEIFGIPLPKPQNVKWSPSTSSGIASEMTGQFLRFGYGSTITGSINKSTKQTVFTVATPTDATKLMVTSQGGSGVVTLIFDKSTIDVKFASPTIKTIQVNSKTAGVVTIAGSNFYTDKSLISVKIGTDVVPSSAITAITQDSLTFNYSPSISSKASFFVTVNTVEQETPAYFSFPPVPISTSYNAPKGTGGIISIKGFCLKGSSPESVYDIKFGAYDCLKLDAKNTQIICSLPPSNVTSGAKNLKVVVSIDGISSTQELLYNYGIPSISHVNQSPNDVVFTVFGNNLGSKESSKVIFIAADKTETILTPSSDSDLESSLTFTLPPNLLKGDIVVDDTIDRSNVIPIKPLPFFKKVKTLPSTDGGLVEFAGAYFDSSAKSSITLLGSRDTNIVCSDFTLGKDFESASCTAAPGCGKIVSTILIGDQNFTVPFSYQPPKELVSTQKANNTLEVKGKNLGPDSSLVVLSVNDITVTGKSLETDVLTFELPDSLYSDNYAMLTVDGVSSESGFIVDLKPICKSITLSNTEGSNVQITGSFFDAKNTFKVTVESKECTDVTVLTPTTIQCKAPAGSGINHNVSVTIEGNSTPAFPQNPIFLSYNPPTVISATSIKQLEGGSVIVVGTNFAETLVSVTINSIECSNVSVSDSSRIVCSLPPLNQTNDSLLNVKLEVQVSVDSQIGKNNVFEYNEVITPAPTPSEEIPTPSVEPSEKIVENSESSIITHSFILISFLIFTLFTL